MSGRLVFSMDKGWSFHLGDVKTVSEKTHGYIYSTSKSGACPGVPQSDYDTREWSVVSLPHDWAIGEPFTEDGVADWGYKPRGKAWYRKVFNLSEEYSDKQLTIEFEGIATKSVVYFNGAIVYRSYSAYTPFVVDISDRAHFGNVPNVIAVFVDADEWEGWWYEGAGIYRHVNLFIKNRIHIPKYGLAIKMKEIEKNTWQVNLLTNICNQTTNDAELRIETVLVDPDKDLEVNINNEGVLCEAGEESQVETEFKIEDPKVWDVDEPNMYNVVTRVYMDEELIDSEKTVCGFRSIAIDAEKGFMLNGRPLKIFGTCNHQDFSGLGVAVPDSIQEYRIERLKTMGCNAYRCAHGMASNALVNACDKLGMLLLDENRHYDTSDEGIRQLRTMVLRDRNHPSVFMYSIFNEEPLQGTKEGARLARRMCSEIYQLDQDKFITGAMHSGILEKKGAVTELDVCGINYQSELYETFHKKFPDIPIVATETTSAYSVRGCYKNNSSEHLIASYDEAPAEWGNTIRETWRKILKHDYIAGAFMWTGFDYMGEPTPYTWPSVSSFFGLMDTCGFAKEGYYMAKAIFSKRPFCHVLPHWNHIGYEGKLVRVMSHTNCEEAELYVNRVSYGKKKVDLFTQVYWDIPYEPGYIELIGYNAGLKVAHDVKVTTGKACRVKVVPWRTKMFNDGTDAIPIKIVAVDLKGHEVPDANFEVEISVAGGSVIATANGNPNCHENFKGNVRSIFNGRCQAIVKANKGENQVLISVSAQGMGIGTIMIPLLRKKHMPVIETVKEQFLTDWRVSQQFDYKPDVNMMPDDYDMNTWEDIKIDENTSVPSQIANRQGHYIIYRIRTTIPVRINNDIPTIHFSELWGECEVFINGEKRADCIHEWPAPLDVKVDEDDCGDAEITVLVKSCNTGAGIHSTVIIH